MDYLTISELYHTQMKGRKQDGIWYYQYKDTGRYTDAGFLRYYGKPRGVPSDITLKAANEKYLKGYRKDPETALDEVIVKVNNVPELAKQFAEMNKQSKAEVKVEQPKQETKVEQTKVEVKVEQPKQEPPKTEPKQEQKEETPKTESKQEQQKKEESPNYIKLLAQERAKQQFEKMQSDKNDSQKQEFDAMKKYNEQAQILDAYEKNRKKYNPTKVEEALEQLTALSKASEEFSKMLPANEGRREYGTYNDLSTQELTDRINRISKERTYSDLVGDTKFIKSGKTKLREALQTVGSVAGIAAALTPAIMALAKKKTGG